MLGSKLRVSFLSILMAALFSLNILQAGVADATGLLATVTGTGVNVRSGPGTNYGKVGMVNKGTKLTVLGQSNGWYKLQFPGGKTGWVIGTYLNVSKSTNSGTVSSPSTAPANKIAVVNGSVVNIRSGPGTNYSILAKVKKGQQLPVIKESNGWYNVNIGNGKSGWILGSLTTVKTTAPAGNGSGTTTQPQPVEQPSGTYAVVKGSIVNIRSGAGTGYSILAKVKAGDQLSVINRSGDWYLVILPDKKQGWIAGWLVDVRSAAPPSRGSTNQPEQPGTGQDSPEQTEEEPAPPPDDETEQAADKLAGLEYKTGDDGEELLEITGSAELKYTVTRLKSPDRIVIDLENSDLNGLKGIEANGKLIGNIRVSQFSLDPMMVRIVIDLAGRAAYKVISGDDGSKLTVQFTEPSIKGKVIAVDAGHGGYDPGAKGVTGLLEKEFNLETALLLKEKLTAMGATVIMTREDDSFISLDGRAAIANNEHADVFVSIHANANNNSSIRGTSTYYYAPASIPKLYDQLDERKSLAASVQNNLIDLLGTRDIGILQANFAVLRNTEMPSILVESAFLTNAEDEALLKDPQFRDKVAQGIADGLAEYFANQ